MGISSLSQFVRNAGRRHEIVSGLTRYGPAPWLTNVRADWVQRHLRASCGQQIAVLTQEARIRQALTELRTTTATNDTTLSVAKTIASRPFLQSTGAHLQAGWQR
jgi:hypothetical protein